MTREIEGLVLQAILSPPHPYEIKDGKLPEPLPPDWQDVRLWNAIRVERPHINTAIRTMKDLQRIINARLDHLPALKAEARQLVSRCDLFVSKWPELRTLTAILYEAVEGYAERDEAAQPTHQATPRR
jgi:hypothetical protein